VKEERKQINYLKGKKNRERNGKIRRKRKKK
jgi:hypothetical protein